jgi:hypothetical protein
VAKDASGSVASNRRAHGSGGGYVVACIEPGVRLRIVNRVDDLGEVARFGRKRSALVVDPRAESDVVKSGRKLFDLSIATGDGGADFGLQPLTFVVCRVSRPLR